MTNFRSTEPFTWARLTAQERDAWLARARDRYFAMKEHPQAPAGTTFTLPGELIVDLSSFLCAMGESVNGPGGYFGRSILAFEDCCVGGFGATRPFTVRWRNSAESRRSLNHSQLALWAKEKLVAKDYPDDEGKEWLEETVKQATLGNGPTLFDTLVEILEATGATVRLE